MSFHSLHQPPAHLPNFKDESSTYCSFLAFIIPFGKTICKALLQLTTSTKKKYSKVIPNAFFFSHRHEKCFVFLKGFDYPPKLCERLYWGFSRSLAVDSHTKSARVQATGETWKMKDSQVNPPPQQFFSMRRLLLRSSEGGICVSLPREWCLRQGLGQLAEIDMWVFQDVLLIFPTDKRKKPSEFKRGLLSAVMMMELSKKLRNAMEDAKKAAKGFQRRLTRDKRAR